MGSSDPERRMRQLALLRAAYDAWPDSLGDRSAARHSRALLGRILIVLGGLCPAAKARRATRATRPDRA